MASRRAAIGLILAMASAPLLAVAIHAEPSFQRFVPFLIDLPGWVGTAPEGTARETPRRTAIRASRSYSRGGAQFYAGIILGTPADFEEFTVQIDVGPPKTSTIDGFDVMTTDTPAFVHIAVTLGPDAVFSLLFNGVSADEAMALARKFDWKGMQAQAK